MFAADLPSDNSAPVDKDVELPKDTDSAPLAAPGVGVVVVDQGTELVERPIPEERLVNAQQYLVSPIQPEGSGNVYMITVVLRATGDKTRDVLRLRRIHGTIMSFPGKDRFAFHVFERGRGYLVEFPNFTTGMSNDLVSKLRMLVGGENVRVEPITFQ
jgi:hypothetical protein